MLAAVNLDNLKRVTVLGAVILCAPSQAAELAVPGDLYPTIESAIHAARDGDSIVLAPGIYAERIVIDKQLSLVGLVDPTSSPSDIAVINGEGIGRVIEITAENVSVQGIGVVNSGDIIEDSDACIYVHKRATGVKLLDNRLKQCAFGIWIHGTHEILLENNTITGNQKPIFSDLGNGINLWNVSKAIVRGNLISAVRDGIYLSVTNYSRIEGNHINNVRFGIHYMYNDDNSVINNTICNSMVGLAFMFSKRLTIKGNVVLNNRDHGMLLRSIYDSEILQNVAIGNNKGLFINDSSFNKLRHNWIEGNAIGVHVMGGSEDNEISQNNFIANPIQVRFSWRHSQFWDGNYWSDYLGWDFDHDQHGDRTYYASNVMDHLLFRYPELKLLTSSPVIQLLQALESKLPVLRPASVIDRHPAMIAIPVNIQLKVAATNGTDCG